jgi:epoxyqueuosine reductase QueG
MSLSERIKKVALESGLDLVGIAPAAPFEGYRWKESIMRNPRLTMSDAQSLVIVAACDLKSIKESHVVPPIGLVARSYAAGHEFNLYDELFPIRELLENEGYQAHISPNTMAASSIPLKLAAVRAGLGLQGKHSVVITPEYGSWITFGALMTNASLEYDKPLTDDICGKCTACIDACPMGAIKEPYIVDMSLCFDEILNTPGNIPDYTKERIGYRILSCDTCLEACPHSRKALKKIKLHGTYSYEYNLLELLNYEQSEFEQLVNILNWGIHFESFKRNVIIALGNSGERSIAEELEKFTAHESEVVRKTSQWALKKLNSS